MNLAHSLKPAWPWQTHPREATGAMIASALAVVAFGGAVSAMPKLGDLNDEPEAASVPVPAAAAATALLNVAPEEALALNAKIPVVSGPINAASPFSLVGSSADSRAQALECLTSAVYYEAGQESEDGQRAVAQVILNRVRHPAFPSSVCGVVYQGSTRSTGCQFTFTCDGSLARGPMAGAWDRARRNAQAMLEGAVFAPVGRATHYHANYVVPYWASSLAKTQVVGAHLFYRWAGGWGLPAAFSQRYSKREPNAAALRTTALAVPHVLPEVLTKTASAEAAALNKVEGVELKRDGGGRIIAKFEPKARAVVEQIKVVPYVDRVAASDNLKFALSGSGAPADQPALGRATATMSDAPAEQAATQRSNTK